MARMRMSMRKIREVLRLTHELGLSVRRVCEATGVGKTAVSEYMSRAKVAGITWPIPPEISDAALEHLLFSPAASCRACRWAAWTCVAGIKSGPRPSGRAIQ